MYSNPHRLLKEWIRSAFRMQQQTSWRPYNPQWHSSTKTFASTMRGKQIRKAKSINCVHYFIAYLCWHALCQHIFVNKKNSIVPYRLLIPLLGGVCWTRRKYGVNNAGMFFFPFIEERWTYCHLSVSPRVGDFWNYSFSWKATFTSVRTERIVYRQLSYCFLTFSSINFAAYRS